MSTVSDSDKLPASDSLEIAVASFPILWLSSVRWYTSNYWSDGERMFYTYNVSIYIVKQIFYFLGIFVVTICSTCHFIEVRLGFTFAFTSNLIMYKEIWILKQLVKYQQLDICTSALRYNVLSLSSAGTLYICLKRLP